MRAMRIVAVSAWCFAFWMMLLSVGLIPMYIQTNTAYEAVLIDHAVQKAQQETVYKSVALRTKDLERTRDAIDRAYAHSPRNVIEKLLTQWVPHMEDIALTSITYEVVVEEEKKKDIEKEYLRVSGEARTRKALDAFVRDLRSVPSFEEVDLPVNDLALDRDVTFSLTISYTP